MKKYQKFVNATQLDFVLQHYGTIDSLYDFYKEVGFENSSEFYNDVRAYNLNDIKKNSINQYFESNGIGIASDNIATYNAELICNNDMTFKSIIIGEYNNDYNDDYNIDSEIVAIIVGYEGMTLTVEWSITNIGNKSGNVSGTVSLGGGLDEDWSGTVLPNSTSTFSVDFINLAEGSYTVTLSGGCIQVETILVLGTPVFQCNDDLAITEVAPYTIGQTITFTWSVTNTGTSSGYYQAYASYINDIFEYNVLITSGETYQFSKDIIVQGVNSRFTDTCNNSIDIIAA